MANVPVDLTKSSRAAFILGQYVQNVQNDLKLTDIETLRALQACELVVTTRLWRAEKASQIEQ